MPHIHRSTMACPVAHSGQKVNGTTKANGHNTPASGIYIKWDAPGVEKVPDGEEKIITDTAAQFNRFQMMNFNEHHHCLRGTHPKTQGCVVGKFIIHDNLRPELAQGMFKRPGVHDMIMRYSSLTPKLVPDHVPAPRGIGMKIFGVEGEKLWGEDKKTQDWTFNNYPILELRDAKTTNEIADSLERNWNQLENFAKELSERPDAEVACAPAKIPRQYLVATPEYSQSAYRHGDYVAKYAVLPLAQKQKDLEHTYLKDDDPINALAQHTREYHMKNKVTYAFCAQLLQNLEEQPVEDIGIEWDDKKYPFEHIATLEFEPQDSWLPEFRVFFDDRITCNSWHGLVEHRPLGSTNRTRRVVYAESRKLRLQVNGYKDYVEPASLKEVPAPVPAVQLELPYQNAMLTVAS